MPLRIQRKRTKGWRLPPNTVCISRPSEFANLWKVGIVACGCRSAGECDHNQFRCETATEAVVVFRELRASQPKFQARAREVLRGKNLSCWCALCEKHKDGKPLDVVCADCSPCHVDPVGEIANA